MKKQIILATLCLIAVLVSVSAVNAANLTVGTGGTYSNIQDAYDDANDGDTIFIKNGTYTGSSNYGISIDKNINITGESQNGTIIDADHNDYVFSVDSGAITVFRSLTIRDANSFTNNGNLTAVDTTFDSCEGGSGGVVHNEEELTFIRCTFTDNEADNGGAIYGCCGQITVENCIFTNNCADGDGGAIYYSSEDDPMTVTGSTFTNNEADDDGGAIYHSSDNGDPMTITGSTFTDNEACDGGAIYNYNYEMIITNCTFTSNEALDCCGGGAIYNDDGTMTITGSAFTNNYCDYDGGAIYNDGPMTITKSTFTNNEAYDCCGGGAIYNDDELTITGCTFTDNKATDSDGGAIYNEEELTITDSTFTGNHADDDGGAIYVCCGDVTLTRSIFNGNSANEDGGAIYFSDETLNITGCNFNKNTAAENGGAIYIAGYGEGNYAVTAKYSRFVGNMVGTTAQDIYMANFGTTLDARYNWWGSNNGPAAGRIAQSEGNPSNEIYTPWLVMNINPADPSTIYTGETSKISVNVYTDSNGVDHSADAAQFFSGPEVTFTTDLGNVGSKTVTVDWILGQAFATLRGDEGPGVATVTAADVETLSTTVNIQQAPVTPSDPVTPSENEVNAASNTVGMHETGIPLSGLILAILAVFGGLLVPKRK